MTSEKLQEKFTGSLLGGMLGDVIGAAVEAESPGYIRKTFKNLDEILELESVPELFGGKWKVGQFTDDTQMSICVAEWLLHESKLDGKPLLKRFSQAYQPWRRYGPVQVLSWKISHSTLINGRIWQLQCFHKVHMETDPRCGLLLLVCFSQQSSEYC
jgi:ADP-ribosylglycohydrolase